MDKDSRQRQQREVAKNYKYLVENYDAIAKDYDDKNFLLLKNQKIVGGFLHWEDAEEAARILYQGDEPYSIQEIRPQPAHLGYQSYAIL